MLFDHSAFSQMVKEPHSEHLYTTLLSSFRFPSTRIHLPFFVAFSFVAILTEYIASSWEKIKPNKLLLPCISNGVCNARDKHDAEHHSKKLCQRLPCSVALIQGWFHYIAYFHNVRVRILHRFHLRVSLL